MSIQTAAPRESRLAVVLFAGLGLVLFVMAVVLVGFVLWDGVGSASACGESDVSMGECVIMARQHELHNDLLFDLALGLAAGGATAIGASVASLFLLRPSREPSTVPYSNG
jgi:ABC-type Co2+ transport system permease subunit